MRSYIYLLLSIIAEVVGSTFLKYSEGFSNIIPSLLLIVFYAISFTLFVLALKTISLSIGYSVWAGLGTAGAALMGVLFFSETLSFVNIIGLFVIISGVVIMNLNKTEDEQATTEA